VSAQPPRELRDERIELDGGVCANCSSEENLQVHHIVPVSNGGKDKLENLQTLCSDCHSKAHADEIGFIGASTSDTDEQSQWIPTINDVRNLMSATHHPTKRAMIVLSAKTNIGISELADINTKDIHINIESNLTSDIQNGNQPYLLVESNSKRQGQQKRLCDTEIPLDKETQRVLLKYLLIRPNSDHNNLFLYTAGEWGEPITSSAARNRMNSSIEDSPLADEIKNKMTPTKLRLLFKDRYPGQSTVTSYISGQKSSLPIPREELFERYLDNIFTLL
jgi:hypothetical protein